MDAKMHEQDLLRWYDNLSCRTVDLVGDYAGKEPFLIDGDSLLLFTFSAASVDLSSGFQILHATYLVESFLQKLRQRKCVFHLVFFDGNAHSCVPTGSSDDTRLRYLLAREAIIQHLMRNIAKSTGIGITTFDGFQCGAFQRYLSTVRPLFLMCHDGEELACMADLTRETFKPHQRLNDAQSPQRGVSRSMLNIDGTWKIVHQRLMIRWFLDHGYNIALINEVQFRDTKVHTMIVDGSTRTTPSPAEARTQGELSSGQGSMEAKNEIGDRSSTADGHRSRDVIKGSPIGLGRHITLSSAPRLREYMRRANEQDQGLTHREHLAIASLSAMVDLELLDDGGSTEVNAMLLHLSLLHEISLSHRAVEDTNFRPETLHFLDAYMSVALAILKDAAWNKLMDSISSTCDLSDVMDGRLYCQIDLTMRKWTYKLAPPVLSRYNILARLLNETCGVNLAPRLPNQPDGHRHSLVCREVEQPDGISKAADPPCTVLPFTDPVFDAHLRPVQVTSSHTRMESTHTAGKLFQDQSHWHNSGRPLDKRKQAPLSAEQARRAQRGTQRYMAEMIKYAESLSGPGGGVLAPETIFVQDGSRKGPREPQPRADLPGKSGPRDTRPKHGGKVQPKLAEKSPRAAPTAIQKGQKSTNKWIQMRQRFGRTSSPAARFIECKVYLSTLPTDSRALVEAEILAYCVDALVQVLVAASDKQDKVRSMTTIAFIWDTVIRIGMSQQPPSDDSVSYLRQVIKWLGLPNIQLSAQCQQRLTFEYNAPPQRVNVNIGMSPLEFQLMHGGPFMDCGFDAAPDARTPDFQPDRWQRDVLDHIDARKSIFVVAPTSAGKTFISFYAMKQILQDDNDGILVYVAPTKALVNQIAAEIQARFSKSYPTKSKSVWAIHTRDYRINNPAGCQILVTVPHILQIMLLAPSNARHWSPRVKRIIFDEIHCIGQAEDGVVWEQLLLLAPCPIIALSATVGNPQEFCSWLGNAQRANGIDLEMVQHRHRSSDLRKYIYHPPETFSFHGFPDAPVLPPLDLDDIPEMTFVHPISSLVDRSRGMPDDLILEPRDCLTLWKAMKKHESPDFPVDPSLEPSAALPPIVKKKDVIRWQEKLKLFLLKWVRDSRSPFHDVQKELSRNAQQSNQPCQPRLSEERGCPRHAQQLSSEDILETTLPLICSLQSRGALPALFFNYDRSQCEQICRRLLDQFRQAEAKWKAESSSWRAKLTKWEEWKKRQEKKSKAARNTKRRPDGGEPQSQASRLREIASTEPSSFETFDPDRPVDGFHVADSKRLQFSQFCEYADELRHRHVPEWLIDALERGIGVHHAGMNRKYRQVCEILFRRGFLRVVIATGTLALGINMPCKTVVFSGDSVYLTALNFRQASGRAGRRGFDLLGNVVFQGIPYAKVCRLISSKLPDLIGHFPITTSLVLRLFILLHGSGRAEYAVRAVNSILSCARIYLGGPEMKDSVLHHLRFSIEYLQRNRLLDSSGQPLNFAGCVSHLYYTEGSGFAFHTLLEAGYFHELCREATERPKQTLMALMLVLSHIFGIQPLRKSAYASACTTKSPSLVVLPPLPEKPAKILRTHNENTRDIYAAYVANYIQQHIREPDCILPLSGMRCGGDHTSTELAFPFTRVPTKITSTFYALSGHRDNWSTVAELCATVRSGVWLEESVIPRVKLYPDESRAPLNAYLYDFFNHGNVRELESANGLRRGDIWFALNDFSLVLATIVASLENFVKAQSVTGEDEFGIMGELDVHEAMLDTMALEHSADDVVKAPGKVPRRTSTAVAMARVVKKSIADRWDEDLSEGEDNRPDDREVCAPKEQIALTADVPSESATKESMCRSKYGTSESMMHVITTFKLLQEEFNRKFRAMWS